MFCQWHVHICLSIFFFFQAEDGIRDDLVTGVQTCALPISMGRKFTRQELYDLVWSQPMKTVSASVGVSDVALAKACRKAQIPVPERGYWAKKQACKRIIKRPLSPRFPGASDEIEVGSGVRAYRGAK